MKETLKLPQRALEDLLVHVAEQVEQLSNNVLIYGTLDRWIKTTFTEAQQGEFARGIFNRYWAERGMLMNVSILNKGGRSDVFSPHLIAQFDHIVLQILDAQFSDVETKDKRSLPRNTLVPHNLVKGMRVVYDRGNYVVCHSEEHGICDIRLTPDTKFRDEVIAHQGKDSKQFKEKSEASKFESRFRVKWGNDEHLPDGTTITNVQAQF